MTGKYLRQVRPDFDERLQPAVRFEFDLSGARKFATLTREHLPEEGERLQVPTGDPAGQPCYVGPRDQF